MRMRTGKAATSPARPRRTPLNLTVRPELASRARALGLNVSDVLERALDAEVRAAEAAAWEAENRDAIDAYNVRVAARGVFSDTVRRF